MVSQLSGIYRSLHERDVPPNAHERLWLYHLLFTIHGVAIWHPDAPEDSLVTDHHVHTLRMLADRSLIPDLWTVIGR